MSFKIFKKAKTYILEIDGVETSLPLCSSVARYKAAIFKQYARWTVEDDFDFVRSLLEVAIKKPCLEAFEALMFQENYYRELNGLPPENAREEERELIQKRKYANELDLMSIGLRADGGDRRIKSLDDVQAIRSLGEWVDDAKTATGIARNRWRSKK